MQITFYMASLLVAAAISLVVAALSWSRRPSEGSISIAILMICVFIWSFAQYIEEVVTGLQVKIFWDSVTYIGIVFTPVSWLLLVLRHTKRVKRYTWRFMILLNIIPTISIVMIATDKYHKLFIVKYMLVSYKNTIWLDYIYGPWFWVHSAYSYSLIFAGIVLLTFHIFKASSAFRKQTAALMTSSIFPLIANMLVTFGLSDMPYADLTPMGFVLAGILIFWAIFRYRLLELVPVARHAVVESMRDILLVYDNTGRVIDLNKAALEAIGKPYQDLLGQRLSDAVPAISYLIDRYRNVSEADDRISINMLGAMKYFDLKITPVYDKKTHVGAHLAILRDVTDLERAMEDLRKSREEAHSANQAKSRFLANMTHELRTPMYSITCTANLLSSTPLSSEQREYVDIITSSIDSLLSIVNNILDFTKAEAGKLILENICFDISAIVRETARMFQAEAIKKDINIECGIGENMPPVLKGDPIRLRQILLNLIGNAVKFTKRGNVRVDLECTGVKNEKADIAIIVSDTGIGISADKIGSLFKSFNQLDSSTTRKFGGTGLGLAIVKELTELMGGSIKVDSKPGSGSSFTIHLDLPVGPCIENGIDADNCDEEGIAAENAVKIAAKTAVETKVDSLAETLAETETKAAVEAAKEAAACNEAAPAISPSGNRFRILLAEDNGTNRLLMKRLLEKQGYSVDMAGNGRTAVEKIMESVYDLVIMDLQMPEMDGMEATIVIREREKASGSHIPIIALTANATDADRVKCIGCGMDDFMPKPVHADALYEMIRKYEGRERKPESGGWNV